mgnify:CR=1 FL=1
MTINATYKSLLAIEINPNLSSRQVWSRPSVRFNICEEKHVFSSSFLYHISICIAFICVDWLSSEIFIGLHLYYGMLDALINIAAIARKVAQCNKGIRDSGKKIRINLVGILV